MPVKKLHDVIQRIEYIDHLIKRKSSPEQIANGLNISLSTWYNYLQVLRDDFDFPILFCSKTKKYYYEQDGKFVWGFRKEVLQEK